MKVWKSLCLAAMLLLPATGQAVVRYAQQTFDFDKSDGCETVEVLDYRYGDTLITGLHADKGFLATGHIPQGEHSSGLFPVGRLLYVKWRDLTNGSIYQKQVDLEGLLPADMDKKVVHFSISGSQLYVYIIEDNGRKASLHAIGAPDCPSKSYRPYRCMMIYPQRWSNF